jgi:hypothetical protein
VLQHQHLDFSSGSFCAALNISVSSLVSAVQCQQKIFFSCSASAAALSVSSSPSAVQRQQFTVSSSASAVQHQQFSISSSASAAQHQQSASTTQGTVRSDQCQHQQEAKTPAINQSVAAISATVER